MIYKINFGGAIIHVKEVKKGIQGVILNAPDHSIHEVQLDMSKVESQVLLESDFLTKIKKEDLILGNSHYNAINDRIPFPLFVSQDRSSKSSNDSSFNNQIGGARGTLPEGCLDKVVNMFFLNGDRENYSTRQSF